MVRFAWLPFRSTRSNLVWGSFFATVGLVLIIVGALMPRIVDNRIDSGVLENVIVDSTTHDGFESWRSNTAAKASAYLKSFYYFNITNLDEVRTGKPPVLEEIGPYVYRYYAEKVDVVFSGDGKTVAHKVYEHHHWAPELNPGKTENDTLVTVNAAYFAILAGIGKLSGTTKWEVGLLSVFLSQFLATLNTGLKGNFTEQIKKSNVPRLFMGLTETPSWVEQVGEVTFGKLKNPTEIYSMASPSSSYVWARPNATTTKLLSLRWGISEELAKNLSEWYVNYIRDHIDAAILKTYSVPSSDLGLLQFTAMKVLGGSLYQFGSSDSRGLPFTFYPELGAYLTFVKTPPAPSLFSMEETRKMFSGYPELPLGFMNATAVGKFLQIMSQNSTEAVAAALNSTFGWTPNQGSGFYSYLQYILSKTINIPIISGNGGLYVTNSVRNFTFGYDDPLMAIMNSDANPVQVTTNHTCLEAAQKELPQSEWTGKDNPNLVMNYITWKNSTKVSGWLTPEPVGGGDASSFPPKLSKDNHPSFSVFSKTLQRQIQLTYSSDTTLKDIDMLEYGLGSAELASEKKNSRNERFYAKIDGLHNMTSVEIVKGAQGIPAFLSKPHMMGVDPSVSDQITMKGNNRPGMNPDPAKHDSFLRIEPTTGKTMDVALRLQVNIQINPDNFGIYFQTPPTYILPVYWVDERSTINDKLASDFRSAIQSPRKLAKNFQIGGVVVGVLALIFGVVLVVIGARQLKMRERYDGPNPTVR